MAGQYPLIFRRSQRAAGPGISGEARVLLDIPFGKLNERRWSRFPGPHGLADDKQAQIEAECQDIDVWLQGA